MNRKTFIFFSLLSFIIGASLFFSSENKKSSSAPIPNIGIVDSTQKLYSREFLSKEFTVSSHNAPSTVCSKKNPDISSNFSPSSLLSSIPSYKWGKLINIITKRCEVLVHSKIIFSTCNLRI